MQEHRQREAVHGGKVYIGNGEGGGHKRGESGEMGRGTCDLACVPSVVPAAKLKPMAAGQVRPALVY